MTAKTYISKFLFRSAATLVVVFSAIGLTSPIASADIRDATMDERIKSYSYYSVFNTECSLHKNINGPGNYDWFNSAFRSKEAKTPIGTLGCHQGTTDWLKDATRLWGFPSDAGDALCDLGYRQQRASSESSRSKCGGNAPVTNEDAFTIDRNGDNNIRAEVMPKIRDKYYGGRTPVWDDAMGYYAAMQQLLDTNVCGATTTKGPNTVAAKMFVVNGDKEIEEKEYFIDESKTSRVQGALYPSGSEQYAVGSPTTPMMRTCFQLTTYLNNDGPAKAYTNYLRDHPGEGPIGITSSTDGDEAEATTSCRVEFIGWIICPAVRFLAQATDTAYVAIESMLTVRTSMFDRDTGTYEIWKVMRNFANVGFVIVFLIVIYSHLTSMGVSNYAIKKMLPRLIVASILVNVSFWICALAVDISNVLGHSLKDLLDGLSERTVVKADAMATGGDGKWDELAMVALGVGYAVGAAFSMFNVMALLPLLLLAAFTIFTVVAIMTLRQALIIILIIIAPIAFVLYLLPNTESWFKKWLGAFRGLLLLFPIIAVIFAGAAVAGQAVMQAATTIPSGSAGNTGEKFLLQVMGAAMMVAPLLMIGTIFNMILNIGGTAFGRMSGMFNNPNKGLFDRGRKAAEAAKERGANSMNRRALTGKTRKFNPRGAVLRQRGLRDAADNFHKQEVQRSITGFAADKASDPNSRFLKQMAGGDPQAQQRAMGSALNTQKKMFAEEVTAATAIIDHLDKDALKELATANVVTDASGKKFDATEDLALQAAAQRKVFATQDQDGIEAILNNAASLDTSNAKNVQRLSNLADEAASSSGRPAYLGMGAIGAMREGKAPRTVNDLKETAINDNAYGMEVMVKADKEELKKMDEFVRANRHRLATDKVDRFKENAHTALNDTRFAGAAAKRVDALTSIENIP